MKKTDIIEIGKRIADRHSDGLAILNGEDLESVLQSERELVKLKAEEILVPEATEIRAKFGTWRAFWDACGVWNEHDLRKLFEKEAQEVADEITERDHVGNIRAEFELVLYERLHKRLEDLQAKERRVNQGVKRSTYISSKYLDFLFGGTHNLIINTLRNKVEGIERKLRENNFSDDEIRDIVVPKLHLTNDEYNSLKGRLRRGYLERYYPTIDDIFERSIEGERLFDGDEKQTIRELMAELAVTHLPIDEGLGYLSLENVNFKSYIELQALLAGAVVNGKSTVFEIDPIRAEIMKSIVKHWDLWEDQMPGKFSGLEEDVKFFGGLEIVREDINDFLLQREGLKRTGYNLINLDYEGELTDRKLGAITGILGNRVIGDEALVFVTLNDSTRKLAKVGSTFGSRDQAGIVNSALSQVEGYEIDSLVQRRYKDSTRMLFLGYRFRRKNG